MQHKEDIFAVGDTFSVKIVNKVGDCYFLSGIPYPFTKEGLKAIWDAEDDKIFEEYEKLGRMKTWQQVAEFVTKEIGREALV